MFVLPRSLSLSRRPFTAAKRTYYLATLGIIQYLEIQLREVNLGRWDIDADISIYIGAKIIQKAYNLEESVQNQHDTIGNKAERSESGSILTHQYPHRSNIDLDPLEGLIEPDAAASQFESDVDASIVVEHGLPFGQTGNSIDVSRSWQLKI